MFSGNSNYANSVDTAFMVVMVISVAFLVLITFLMIFFVIKYNKKRHPKAVNIHGNIPLEVTWTVIPTLLVLVMFWFGWVAYKDMTTIPKDSMVIDLTAQMWHFKFKYQTGLQTDTLYVPVKTPVKINLHSLDVNHALFIPAFRLKKDVIPNRTNVAFFNAEKIGSYDIACAEYCGLNHSHMYTKVVVMPVNDFNNWLNKMTPKTSSDSTSASENSEMKEENSMQSDSTKQK